MFVSNISFIFERSRTSISGCCFNISSIAFSRCGSIISKLNVSFILSVLNSSSLNSMPLDIQILVNAALSSSFITYDFIPINIQDL